MTPGQRIKTSPEDYDYWIARSTPSKDTITNPTLVDGAKEVMTLSETATHEDRDYRQDKAMP
ncbi:hypothetical protein LTR28_011533, partial [Elasticomyces elasticus]